MHIKIPKEDWQYFAPFLLCLFCFITTEFLGLIEKSSVAYWSGRLFFEPYRIITSHFFHGNINHLLANITGIVITRFFLKALGLKNNYFFLIFIICLIPIQSIICWFVDMFIFKNHMSLAIGFSGVLYGIDAFILLTTIFGKKSFLLLECGLRSSSELFKSISVLTGIGIVWSFLPGISLLGHFAGLITGIILFLL